MKDLFTELDGHNQVKVERDGFTFTARIMHDDDADISWLGEFSDKPADKFAIAHDQGNNRTFNYFNAENVENDEQAQQNYRRAASYGESWTMYGVVVHVIKDNIKLGTASVWGIESDSDDKYFVEVANDIADEALTDAQTNLGKLNPIPLFDKGFVFLVTGYKLPPMIFATENGANEFCASDIGTGYDSPIKQPIL